MSDQQILFGKTVERSLSPRQERVYEALLRLRPDGIDAAEAGALLHADRGKHSTGERCQWCAQEGRDVLSSLRSRGLVIRRRSGLWQLRSGRGVGDSAVTGSASPYHVVRGDPVRPGSSYDPTTSPWPF